MIWKNHSDIIVSGLGQGQEVRKGDFANARVLLMHIDHKAASEKPESVRKALCQVFASIFVLEVDVFIGDASVAFKRCFPSPAQQVWSVENSSWWS